jgi:hypothetical protein
MSDIIGAPPQQPTYPQITVNIPPEGGMVISVVLAAGISLNQAIDDASMQQIVKNYLNIHPELTQQLIRETLTLKQGQLAMIEHVKRSRND